MGIGPVFWTVSCIALSRSNNTVIRDLLMDMKGNEKSKTSRLYIRNIGETVERWNNKTLESH